MVLIFGVNKLPRLGKGLGEGIRNFKDSVRSENKPADENANGEAKNESVDPS